MSNMKNIPEKIYLQIGDECDSEDFNELSEVSWCKDKIYDNDIEFVQNKVSNISADTKPEEDLIYRIVENWGNAVHPVSEMVGWLKEYASIVNDSIPADFKQVTGHDSPKKMAAYEKGREDEQKVCTDWIEKWDGSDNSVMGALLKKKFDERKDNVGVWVKVEFKDMDRMILTRKSGDTFTAMNNSRNEGLFDFFSGKDKPESQPQQKEVEEDVCPECGCKECCCM